MSYDISDWGTQSFEFKPNAASDGTARTAVAIHEGPLGPTAVVPDAHLLFSAHFERAGADLILRGDHGKVVVVHDYFASDHPPQLLSPDGAALSPEVVVALAGPLAPGQYAQAAPTPSGAEAVGRIVKVVGDATVIRNGVAVTLHIGDAVLKGDVLRTGGGSLGVTFNDGSTLNLTAHARLVVNEFVYDAHSTNNSEVLNLVQGSLTFISGHVAHQGHMKITTPVATLGIRGTVGGVTEANDGTVSFFVAESATGAVLTDNQGHVLGQVLQDGPMLVVRPVGPLNVLAEEVQKTPAELAKELAIVQQIVSLQSVGQQIIQQDLQPNNNPNPHSIGHPHTQIEIQFPSHLTADSGGTGSGSGSGGTTDNVTATVHTTTTGNSGTIIADTTGVVHVTSPADTTAPNPPVISVINDLTHAVISDGGSTNDATPTIHVALSGTGAIAGDTVELFNGTFGLHNPVTLTATDIAAGFVEFSTPTLSDGSYHLNASITDAAGNTSVASNEFDFTIDTHAPTLASVAAITYNDTAAYDHFDAKCDTLVRSDAGAAAALTYGIEGGAADTSHGGYDISQVKTYGTLYVNSASGAYDFVPNDSAINALSTPTTEHFTVTVSDLAGNSGQQDFTVALNGVNDAAVISGTTTGAVTEAGGVDNGTPGTPTATGTLTDTDVDNPANTFQAVVAGTRSISSYGTYAMTAAGVWLYTLDNSNAAVQALNPGEHLTDSFTVHTVDGTAQVVNVTIDGANDVPVIGGTSTGSLQEDSGVDANGHLVTNGTLAVTDPDAGQSSFQAQTSAPGDHGYGNFSLDAAGHWTYTVDDHLAAIQQLNTGDSLTDSFSAVSADGTASQLVTVTIHGVTDAAAASLTSTAGVQISGTAAGATDGFVLPGAGNVTTPGTPEDRIVLGFDSGPDHVVLSNAPQLGHIDMTPISSSSYSVDGTSYFSSVLSAGHDVNLTQTISLGADANFFTTAIDVSNNGNSDISNVRFMRSFDPDQDLHAHNTFNTLNDVIQNPDGSSSVAAVQATGPVSGVHAMLVGDGADWRGSAFGFTNTDPYDSFAFDHPQDPNGASADIAIALTNALGTIHPGEHAEVSFLTTANVATTGANALVGTPGADTIDGLGGHDVLFGLRGADTFVFKPGYDQTTIADFTHGSDHIDLTAVADASHVQGQVNAANTVDANSISWYVDQVHNQTVVYVNTNGVANHVDMEIHLTGTNVDLTGSDILHHTVGTS